MALDKNTLTEDLKEILSNPSFEGNVDAVAEKLANAFDKFVKTGKATGTDSRGDQHNLTIS